MVDNCGEALDSDGIDLWSDSKCAYHIYKTYEVIKEGYETLENAL